MGPRRDFSSPVSSKLKRPSSEFRLRIPADYSASGWPRKEAQMTLRALSRQYAVDLGPWFVRACLGVQCQAGFMLNFFAPEAAHREMVRAILFGRGTT